MADLMQRVSDFKALPRGALAACAILLWPPAAHMAPAECAAPAPTSGSLEMRARSANLGRPLPSSWASPAALDAATTDFDEEHKVFWAWDYEREHYYEVEADLRHVGPRSIIYTESGSAVTGTSIRDLAIVFEDVVYPRLRESYGHEPEPGVDGRQAVTLLLLDIRDPLYYGRAPHSYIAGYFDPANESLQADLDGEQAGRRSNEREMLYLDVGPAATRGEAIAQTLAHEFAHLIQWNHDPQEEGWLVEAMGQMAVHVCGLGHPRAHIEHYLAEPEASITSWNGEVRDYGKVYLFMLYLFEQVDDPDSEWLRSVVQSGEHGMSSLMQALPIARPPDELFRDYGVALYLDALIEGRRFGFESLDLDGGAGPKRFPRASRHLHRDFPIASTDLRLAPWTVRADSLASEAGGLELELVASLHACLASGLRDAAVQGEARWSIETKCVAPGEPVLWLVPPASNGGSSTEFVAISANAGTTPMMVTLSALPPAGVESPYDVVYLPVTVKH